MTLIFEEEHFTGSRKMDVLCLLVFSAGASLWGLAAGPPLGDHEAIVAQGACQIRQGGGWLIPHVSDVPFVRKPPLAFWLTAAGSMVVDPPGLQPPVSQAAARLPSGLAALLTVALVYVLGRSLFNHRIAMVSGAVMASCVGTIFYSHNAQVEMVQTLFCTASFAFFWLATESGGRRSLYLVLFYVSFALAMLAKAPFPAIAVGLPIAVWWFVTVPLAKLKADEDGGTRSRSWLFMRQLRGVKGLLSGPGIFLFVLLVLPWPVYVYLTVDNVIDLWRLEFFARYTGGLSVEAKPFWYYIPLALGMLLPFGLSLFEATASPFLKAYSPHRRGLLFAFTCTVVVLGFLSTSAFKAPRYLIVCVPGFALLLGPTLDRLFLAARTFSKRSVYGVCVLVAVSLPIGLVSAAVLLERRYSEAAWAYYIAGTLFVVGCICSCILFARRMRLLSFAAMCLTTALTFACCWTVLGQTPSSGGRAFALIEQFNARLIGDNDRITWAIGRPDSRVMYYMGTQIHPLFSPLEMAPLRENRNDVSTELMEEGARRLERLLSSEDVEAYVIIDAKYWNAATSAQQMSAREVFRVQMPGRKPSHKDWVVVTNEWNTGEWEDLLPAATERDAKLPTLLEPRFGMRPGGK